MANDYRNENGSRFHNRISSNIGSGFFLQFWRFLMILVDINLEK